MEARKWKSAKVVQYLEVTNPVDGHAYRFKRDDFCIIRHPGLNQIDQEDITLDHYWKGCIQQIRKTKQNMYLAKVSWLYTARQLLERGDVTPDIKKYTNTFGREELCGSNATDIIDACTLEDIIDVIIIKNKIEDQPPVTMYYMRYFWDTSKHLLQGEPEICGAIDCPLPWSPDLEEQRYCWTCKRWLHLSCLGTPLEITQDQYLDNLSITEKFSNTPKIILRVAFQPTARGGQTHFTAGNIRIVNKARALLSLQEQVSVESSGWMAAHLLEKNRSAILDSDWEDWLKAEFGMDNIDSDEPLVVTNQLYYTCPRCRSEFVI